MRYGIAMVAALARRPWLVATTLRQLKSLSRPRWWSEPPYLPLPPADYLEFRQVTATGSATAVPDVQDTVIWLEWCRSLRKLPRA